MSEFKTRLLGAAAVAAALLISTSASAAILYNNPAVGYAVGFSYLDGYNASNIPNYSENSFSFTGNRLLTGVEFDTWTTPGDTVTTLQWGILDGKLEDPSSSLLGYGFAAVTATFFAQNFLGYDINFNEFGILPLSLGAGTYWLVLSDAATAQGNLAGWDSTIGTSQFDGNQGAAFSNTFKILGEYPDRPPAGGGCNPDHPLACVGVDGGGVPEPATWALMLLGFGGIGAVLRRRRVLPSPIEGWR